MSNLSLLAIWFNPGQPRFLFDLDKLCRLLGGAGA